MKTVSFDTETTGLTPFHGCRPFMFQACDGKQNLVWEGKVNPYNRAEVTWDTNTLEDFLDYFESVEEAIFQNLKFDTRMIDLTMRDLGITGFKSLCQNKSKDLMLATHALCSGDKLGLAYNAVKYLRYDNDAEDKLKQETVSARADNPEYDLACIGHPTFGGLTKTKVSSADYWLVPEACKKYGTVDVEMTLLLWRIMSQGLTNENLWEQFNTRMDLLWVLYDMEDAGMYLYQELIDDQVTRLKERAEELRLKIQTDQFYNYTIDLTKDDEIKFLIHGKLEIPVLHRTATNRPSINKEALADYIESYPSETLEDFKEYRSTNTQISDVTNYRNWVCPDGRLHANYWVCGTRETRQSVEMPNLQNIGKGIRHLMGPPPGKVWLDSDLVNIEMRRWVYYVGNKEIIDVFESGGSFHLLVCSILYPDKFEEHGEAFKDVYKSTLYQWVKNGNFSILYGAGEKKADASYGKRGAYAEIKNRLPEVPRFIYRTTSEVENNYREYNQAYVTVDGGYRLEVPLDKIYKAANYKVQGSAGWIMGEAMIEVTNNPYYKSTSCRIVQQVHDSIAIELDEQDLSYDLVQSIRESIEAPGYKYMPTNAATIDIVAHYKHPGYAIDHQSKTIVELF